jgi:hypothetical protein
MNNHTTTKEESLENKHTAMEMVWYTVFSVRPVPRLRDEDHRIGPSKLQRLRKSVLLSTGNIERCTPVREFYVTYVTNSVA